VTNQHLGSTSGNSTRLSNSSTHEVFIVAKSLSNVSLVMIIEFLKKIRPYNSLTISISFRKNIFSFSLILSQSTIVSFNIFTLAFDYALICFILMFEVNFC
jgi:hypothetical protein